MLGGRKDPALAPNLKVASPAAHHALSCGAAFVCVRIAVDATQARRMLLALVMSRAPHESRMPAAHRHVPEATRAVCRPLRSVFVARCSEVARRRALEVCHSAAVLSLAHDSPIRVELLSSGRRGPVRRHGRLSAIRPPGPEARRGSGDREHSPILQAAPGGGRCDADDATARHGGRVPEPR